MNNRWPKAEWHMARDFNAIKKYRERKGTKGHFNRGEADKFNSFIRGDESH